MGNGRFDEALAVLRPLVRGRVVEADTLFLFGLAALGAAQKPELAEAKREALLDETIASFHAMLVRRPELMRVRLELGRAFFLKGEDGLAKHNFEQVLAGDPPDAVVRNVNRFLSRIRARKRWTMRLGMAIRARQQHRRGLGRTDHLHRRLAVSPGPGGADPVGGRRFGLGGR